MLRRRTIRGPSTGLFHTPVCTVRPRHDTSFGIPTLRDNRVAIRHRLALSSPGRRHSGRSRTVCTRRWVGSRASGGVLAAYRERSVSRAVSALERYSANRRGVVVLTGALLAVTARSPFANDVPTLVVRAPGAAGE